MFISLCLKKIPFVVFPNDWATDLVLPFPVSFQILNYLPKTQAKLALQLYCLCNIFQVVEHWGVCVSVGNGTYGMQGMDRPLFSWKVKLATHTRPKQMFMGNTTQRYQILRSHAVLCSRSKSTPDSFLCCRQPFGSSAEDPFCATLACPDLDDPG